MKAWVIGILAVVVVGGVWFFGPDIYRYMGGRYENARTEIFQNSIAKVNGTIENLNRLKLEYETAGVSHKAALRTAILTTLNGIDEKKLPSHLYVFVNDLRRN